MAEDEGFSETPSGLKKQLAEPEKPVAPPVKENKPILPPMPKVAPINIPIASQAPQQRQAQPVQAKMVATAPILPRLASADMGVSMPRPKAPAGAEWGGGFGGTWLVLVALIAFAALYMAYDAKMQMDVVKQEAKLLANDLQQFRDRQANIRAPVEGSIGLYKQFPLSDVFPPDFKASGSVIIPLKTTLRGVSTAGIAIEVPIDQVIVADFEVPVNFTKKGRNVTLVIDEDIPLQNQANIIVTAGEVWGEDLDDVIFRLQKISGER